MATPQRLPIVNSDDGTWGDIIRQYLMKEHYNDDTDNPVNGGHQKITIRPGTATAGTAPLKFTSGALLTTPEAGAVEFTADSYYVTTTTGPTRKKIAAYDDSAGATGDLHYRDGTGNFVRLGIGTSGTILTSAGGLPAWQSPALVPATTRTISQTVHGFAVGNVVRYNGTSYVKAQADNVTDADVDGIVSSVIDANTFVLAVHGYVTGLSGLTAGTDYYLSPTTAGAMTATVPTTVGQVVCFLLKADSATSGYFRNSRGSLINSSASGVSQTTVASSSTPTPSGDSRDNEYFITALAANATFAAPTGTPTNGNKLFIRVKDNGISRTLAWNAIYSSSGIAILPTSTVVNKTMSFGFKYDSTANLWVLLASDNVGY